MARVLADKTNEPARSMRRIRIEVQVEMMVLEERIAPMNKEIDAITAHSDTARRLMTMSGQGGRRPSLTTCCISSDRCQALERSVSYHRLQEESTTLVKEIKELRNAWTVLRVHHRIGFT